MELDRLVARAGRFVARAVVGALIVGALLMTIRSCVIGDGGSLEGAEFVRKAEVIGNDAVARWMPSTTVPPYGGVDVLSEGSGSVFCAGPVV